MTARERTRQQLDPAGTAGVRPFSTAMMLGIVVFAVVMTIQTRREISSIPMAVLSLGVLAAAAALVIVGVSPYRAPLSRGTHFLAQLLVLVAVFLAAASGWGADSFIRDDWGSIAVGVLLLVLGPYRPASELAFAGVVSAILIGFLTLLQAPYFATQAPPAAFILLTTATTLSMCFGGVVYSLGVTASIENWQRRAGEANKGLMDELRDGIARSVRQDRVTILGRDVLPFFTTVLSAGQIADAHREQARRIAESIRAVMVAEVDRSWLENVVELTVLRNGGRSGAAAAVIRDGERLAGAMTADQRTAMRALLVALIEPLHFDQRDIGITLTREGIRCNVLIAIRLTAGDRLPRVAFAPYLALLQSAFEGFEVHFDHPHLRLRFWYEQH